MLDLIYVNIIVIAFDFLEVINPSKTNAITTTHQLRTGRYPMNIRRMKQKSLVWS